MKTWNVIFFILLSISLAGIFSASAFAQGEVYRYTTTSFTGTFTDISSSGTFIAAQDDETYTFTGPPFAFNYDSVNYAANTTMYVQTNGYTGWSSLNTNYNDGIGDFTDEPNAICPFCCDLVTGGQVYDDGPSGGLYYQVTGVTPNRVFIIEWDNFETYENEIFTSMEVKLYESTNVIELVYHDLNDDVEQPADGNGGGTGLNGQSLHSPNDYLRYGSSEQLSTPSSDVRFTPPSVLPPQEFSLTPNPKLLNFGTTSAGVPILLSTTVNSVGAIGTSITITGTSLTGSSAYSVISGPPNGTIVPQGSSVQYVLQFLPLNSGTLTGMFTVATTGRDSGTQVMNLTGVGAVPDVSYSATSMFRGVNTEVTDTSGVQYLYVNSTGIGPLNIKSITFYGLDTRAYFVTHMPAASIPGGGVDSIGLRFVPDLEGLPDAHMVINTNAANTPWDTVGLFGVGILPHLVIDSGKSYPLPLTVNFDSVNLGSDSTLSVQLWNSGSDTLAIEKNYYESNDPDFTLVPITGTDTLIPPGGTQNIQITFTPLQQGHREAEIRIRTNIPHTLTTPIADTSSFIVNVEGTGVPHGTPSIRTFGPLNGDTLIVGKQYCVTDTFWNNGTGPLIIDSVRNLIPSAATFTFPSFPLTIQPDSVVTFGECITLMDTGTFNGVCNPGGCATVITYSQAPVFSWSQLPMTVYGIQIGDTAIVLQPFFTTCGPDTETILMQNTENAPESYVASISGGSNPGDFTVTPTTSPVESAGGTVTFTVAFNPSTTSLETANLNIAGGTPQSVPLSTKSGAATIVGSGTATTAMPSALMEQFNDTIMNTGSCTWTPGVPTIPEGSPFAYVNGGATSIPAGGTGMLEFTFTPPGTEGSYSAAVSFPNSIGLSLPAATDTVFGSVSTAGIQETSASSGYSLEQNYPNPFNGTSQLTMTLPVGALVHLSIIDVQGQVVETLLNQHYDAGSFSITLDASQLASGTYYYQMNANGVTLTRQMVILK